MTRVTKSNASYTNESISCLWTREGVSRQFGFVFCVTVVVDQQVGMAAGDILPGEIAELNSLKETLKFSASA